MSIVAGRRGKALRGLLFATSFAIPAIILYRTWGEMSQQGWHLRYGYLALAFVLYCSDIAVAIGAWHLLTHRLGAGLPLLQGARVYCVSLAANKLPGGIWGYASRVYLAKGEKASALRTGFAVLLEMLFVLVAGLLIGLLYLVFYRPFAWPWPLYAVIVMGFCAILWVAGRGQALWRIFETALRIVRRPAGERQLAPGSIRPLLWVAIYAVGWLIGGLMLAAVTKAFFPVATGAVLQTVGIWALAGSLSMLIFFVPNGLGLREIGIIFLLRPVMPTPAAAAVALATRGLTILTELLWMSLLLALPRLRAVGRREVIDGSKW